MGADYSQIELRVLAHLSEDPTLIDSFRKGTDIHKTTAAKVFEYLNLKFSSSANQCQSCEFRCYIRDEQFRTCFRTQYFPENGEKYIDEYFNKYSKVKAFMDRQIDECKKNGYVTTIMNRKRPIPENTCQELYSKASWGKVGHEQSHQGSAADIIKIAMIKCHKQLLAEGLKSRLILQVHDELIIQTHRDELERVKTILKENMENAIQLKVPLSVELNTGKIGTS